MIVGNLLPVSCRLQFISSALQRTTQRWRCHFGCPGQSNCPAEVQSAQAHLHQLTPHILWTFSNWTGSVCSLSPSICLSFSFSLSLSFCLAISEVPLEILRVQRFDFYIRKIFLLHCLLCCQVETGGRKRSKMVVQEEGKGGQKPMRMPTAGEAGTVKHRYRLCK